MALVHRLMTILILPTVGFSYWFIPPSERKKDDNARWRLLDPIGALLRAFHMVDCIGHADSELCTGCLVLLLL